MPALPAFRSRNYRLFFAGQLVSLIGTWMQQIALGWLAYRLTDSAFMLGLVSFAGQIPILLFSAASGVWIDRLDRRRLLLCTQALSMLQAGALTVLAFTQSATPSTLVLLAMLLGCINAIDLPTRQVFVTELIEDKAHLANAIGLNSFLMNGSRFVGPAIAGLIVATAGETVCFLINTLSYLAVLAALAAIRTTPRAPPPKEPALTALKAGLDYAFRHPQIRLTLTLVASFSFLVTPYAAMMPVFARDFFTGGADTYGFLIGSAGGGSLFAALFLALRGGQQRKGEGLDRITAAAALGGGVALSLFAVTHDLRLAYPLLTLLGFCVVTVGAGCNVLIQTLVAENYRGRVMALYSTAFLGIAPLGSLAAGTAGTLVGVRETLTACGLLTTLLAIRHARRLTAASPA